MTTIKIISDIHLELYKKLPHIPLELTEDTVLVLAGDIGKPSLPCYEQFLSDVSQKCLYVLLIAGNHEYYNNNKVYTFIDANIVQLCQQWSNVYFLQNSSIILGGIKYVGTTLWTDTSDDYIVKTQMNDYKRIKTKTLDGKKQGITTEMTTKWHKQAVEYLERELQEDITTVVITHHAPSFISLGEDDKEGCSRAYASNLEYLIKPPVKVWIHGHHHTPVDYMLNDVRVVSNPYGYLVEDTGYNPELSIIL